MKEIISYLSILFAFSFLCRGGTPGKVPLDYIMSGNLKPSNGFLSATAYPAGMRCFELEKNGHFKTLWEIKGWWEDPLDVFFSGDLNLLIRVCEVETKQVGSALERAAPNKDTPLLEFYDGGKLVKRVTVGEVVKDKDLVIKDSNPNPFSFYCGQNAMPTCWPLLGTVADMVQLVGNEGGNFVNYIFKKLDSKMLPARNDGDSHQNIFIFDSVSGERLIFIAKTGELLHRYDLADKTYGIADDLPK